MNAKRVLSLFLMLTMLLSLAACTPSAENPNKNPGGIPSETPGETPNDKPDNKPDDQPTEPAGPFIAITPDSNYTYAGTLATFTVTGEGFDREALTYTVTEGMANAPIITETGCKTRILREGELTVTVSCGELSASCTVKAFPDYTTVTPDDDMIYYLGRTEMSGDKMLINNTASGFEIKFFGKSISVKMRNEGGESFFAVFVDGETDPEAHKIDLKNDQKNGRIVLAEFETAGVHTIRVQKTTEEQISRASLSEITIEKGGLLPHTPQYALKIEVYGDSITAGYGNMREVGETDDIKRQNGLLTYAGIAATRLNAEYRAFCWSGLGLYTNPYNSTRWLKDTYNNVSYNSNTKYDMTAFTPDIVIINIGTNDIWATNGSTGNQPFNANDYIEHYVDFVTNLYQIYGESTTFILCSGMLETGLANPIQQVVYRLHDAGITGVYNAVLPRATYGGHPCLVTHQEAAEVLLKAIADATGYEVPKE